MKILKNDSALSCRTLFRNKDKTYTVFIEIYDKDKSKVKYSYERNYGLFGEALNCVNYQENK